MRPSWPVAVVGALVCVFQCGCSPSTPREEILRQYPVDGLEGVLTRSGVDFDKETSVDGNGSLKIRVTEPATVRIYEVDDVDVEDARLIYRAHVRTEGVQGRVYLEMWCRFPGRGEFFSRALHSPISGTTGWTTQETLFFLEAGQKPDNIKLNIVIDGSGTVWVDQVLLAKSVE